MATRSTNSTNKFSNADLPSNSKTVNQEEEEDMISNLPEAILTQILSCLTTEEAIATSVLSKRWRYLWTLITTLKFSDYHIWKIHSPNYFINYVDRVLLLHDSPYIQNFSLILHSCFHHFHINKWISDVVTRNLRELNLCMMIDHMTEMELPSCVYYCNTLEVLKLGRGFEFKIPKPSSAIFPNLKVLQLDCIYYHIPSPAAEGFVYFPVLKTLHLHHVVYENDDDGVGKFVCHCPVLEDLVIQRNDTLISPDIDICSPMLRSCEIDFEDIGCNVQLDAPGLQYITVNDWDLAYEFSMKEMNSLIEVKLIAANNEAVVTGEQQYNAHKLIKAVDKAQNLSVGHDYIVALKAGIGIFPVFSNLTQLEVYVGCCELTVLQCLLENSMNLQYLVIRKGRELCGDEEKWWSEQAIVPYCLTYTLKRVEICDVVSCIDEVALIKYMLKNAKVLEKIEIQTSRTGLREKYELLEEKISLFPRGSMECEIVFSR